MKVKSLVALSLSLGIGFSALTFVARPALASSTCTISGTAKSDVLIGTAGDDVICGFGGNDRINGLGGNDIILGGAGNDSLMGGSGNDKLDGGEGKDTIEGGSGFDDIDGSAGNDSIFGGLDNDQLSGDGGSDSISGGAGRDFIEGNSGPDSIRGEAGDDLIDGGADRDKISSGRGEDSCTKDVNDIHSDPCLIDTAAPEFGMMTTQVRDFKAGGNLNITWLVSDSASVRDTWASIGGAPGWVTNWCVTGSTIMGNRISGDEFSGTYGVDCVIPNWAVNGSYTLFISATDIFGNVRQIQVPFTVSSGSEDDDAPLIGSVIAPKTSTGGSEFSVSFNAKDETGIQGLYVWIAKKGHGFWDGAVYATAKSGPILVSGDKNWGTYRQDFTFRDPLSTGEYELWISARDELGNKEFNNTGVVILVN